MPCAQAANLSTRIPALRYWLRLIQRYVQQARATKGPAFEETMLDIAALAIAAIHSSRRRRAVTIDDRLGAASASVSLIRELLAVRIILLNRSTF